MKEREIKFIVDDLKSAARTLKKAGAVREWKGTEESSYFDLPGRALRKRGIVLRLRRWKGDSDTLTCKIGSGRNAGKVSEREELQTTLGNQAAMRAILRALGYRESFRYRKEREHWKLGKTAIELDTLGKKKFVEIEGTKREIERLSRLLGLDWKRSTLESYVDILGK